MTIVNCFLSNQVFDTNTVHLVMRNIIATIWDFILWIAQNLIFKHICHWYVLSRMTDIEKKHLMHCIYNYRYDDSGRNKNLLNCLVSICCWNIDLSNMNSAKNLFQTASNHSSYFCFTWVSCRPVTLKPDIIWISNLFALACNIDKTI